MNKYSIVVESPVCLLQFTITEWTLFPSGFHRSNVLGLALYFKVLCVLLLMYGDRVPSASSIVVRASSQICGFPSHPSSFSCTLSSIYTTYSYIHSSTSRLWYGWFTSLHSSLTSATSIAIETRTPKLTTKPLEFFVAHANISILNKLVGKFLPFRHERVFLYIC